jgi:hypothetical protein
MKPEMAQKGATRSGALAGDTRGRESHITDYLFLPSDRAALPELRNCAHQLEG